ncbi:MAG: DUF6883 domain-containing protein [Gemmatimonas sp.]|jgi:hypothetical protein|uniref:DUF6883 domain-containing protein n=1 Tax=Gemmatimonas sp. TaxID=1962908 RepID=UPI00391F36AC
MRLPNADQASIDPMKLRGYLLSPEHPVGQAEARFFMALGFHPTDWPRLRTALERHGRLGRAREVPSPYGRKFEVEGIIEGPSGRKAAVVSVWIILRGEVVPRLVTALPGARA